jgi:hypothetical protein
MRTAKLLAVVMASLASIPLMAQQVNAAAQQRMSGSAAGTHVNQSDDAEANANLSRRGHADANGAAANSMNAKYHSANAKSNESSSDAGSAEMRPLAGELMGNLDSKSAKVRQPVVLKTTQEMKTADGFVIPKGSRLIGHVTEVQAHSRGHERSSLGVAFDRAELKNGKRFAIHCVIESVGPSEGELEAASMAKEDAFSGPAGGGMAGGGTMGGGSVGAVRTGGGLLGGGGAVVGGATSAVANVGSVDSGVASNAGGTLNAGGDALNAPGNLAGNAAGHAGRGIYGSAGMATSLGAHATAIPGVMLEDNAAGGASGVFAAAQKNIHLDSGTQMVLGVAAAVR